jgi:hypothetical protein
METLIKAMNQLGIAGIGIILLALLLVLFLAPIANTVILIMIYNKLS